MSNKNNRLNGDQKKLRCGIYTRKSHEEGLEQEFNSLDAQRECAEAYIESQRMQGWTALPDRYDDGGFSGGTMERPALKRLISDIEEGRVDIVIVYKIDRLSRSLLDFMKMIEYFNEKNVSFVSVTQNFQTTDPTGRMMLGILITFAQYEREIIGERIRDKISASKKRGKYCGGPAVLGYDRNSEKKLIVNQEEADLVRFIFKRYKQLGSARMVARELNGQGYTTKGLITRKGKERKGVEWKGEYVYRILRNRLYMGEIQHKNSYYSGEHEAIVDRETWNECCELLLENRTVKLQKARTRTISPLAGILRCGHCDGAMSPSYAKQKDRRYSYYICSKDSIRANHVCPVRRVSSGEIEREVFNQLSAVFRTPTLIAKTYFTARRLEKEEIQRLSEQKERLKKSLGEIRKKAMETVQSDVPDKTTVLNELNRESANLQNELTQVKSELKVFDDGNVTEKDVADAFYTVETFWEYLYPLERNNLMKLLVEKIEVRETGIDILLKTNGITDLVKELTERGFEAEERVG